MEKEKNTENNFLKRALKMWLIAAIILVLLSIVLGITFPQYLGLDVLIVASLIGLSFWAVHYWYKKFTREGQQEEKAKNPYQKVFFNGMNFISIVLLLLGIVGGFLIYTDENGSIYHAIGLIIIIIWTTAFLRYFLWSVYFYNINYGLTDKDWSKIFEAEERKRNGEYVDPQEMKRPDKNPYRGQTFGLPQGTVRGMIAFTLLFGAIAMIVISMGMDAYVKESSFFWDHYEFFKTAFLMMIAFYFGDRSLRYLSKRWPSSTYYGNKSKNNKAATGNQVSIESEDDVEIDNLHLDQEEMDFDIENTQTSSISHVASISNSKRILSQSEASFTKKGKWIPVIDAGHGGMVKGKYTTGEKKKYTFEADGDKEGFTIYEGVINREIGAKLIQLLQCENIPYYDLTVSVAQDMSLPDRVKKANEIFNENQNTYFLSIHSNAVSASIKGKGSSAKGFEIFTSVGETKSDELAAITAKWYKKSFPDYPFRVESRDELDKERNFYVLRNTRGPALLVENLFFDNRKEAEFLISEGGQQRIANCLCNAIKEIYYQDDPVFIA